MSQEKLSKVKPPFPNLAIFNVTAVVLALFGFDDEVKELLWKLSHKSRKYFAGHKEILGSFIIPWSTEIKNYFVSFGHEALPWDQVYPRKAPLYMEPDLSIRLKAVRYKRVNNVGALSGIQFIFSDNSQSPMFATR